MPNCRKCGDLTFTSNLTPHLNETRLCQECYGGKPRKITIEDIKRRDRMLEGASPERMKELKAMADEGTLADHCVSLLHRIIDSL